MIRATRRPSSRTAGFAGLAVVAGLLAGGIPSATAAPATSAGSAAGSLPLTGAQPLAVIKGKGKGKGGKVKWDVTTISPGTALAAHGKLPGRTKGKRKVRMQVKIGRKWDTIGKTKTDRKGTFAINGALDWYGTHKVRVTTSGKRPFKRGTKVQVLVPYTPRGDAYVEITGQSGGTAIGLRPDPCKTFTYVVNADDVGVPVGVAMATLAMAQLSYATGIKTKYLGTSTEIPFHASDPNNPGGAANLLIGWGTGSSEIPELPQNNAVGLTDYVDGKVKRDGNGKPIYSTTELQIALDTDYWYSGIYGYGFVDSKPSVAQTMVHELGHAFGLDHPEPKDQIMSINGRLPQADGTYRAQLEGGDLAGLKALSLEQGCHQPYNSNGNGSKKIAAPELQPVP